MDEEESVATDVPACVHSSKQRSTHSVTTRPSAT